MSDKEHKPWCASVPRPMDAAMGRGPYRCDCGAEPASPPAQPSGEPEKCRFCNEPIKRSKHLPEVWVHDKNESPVCGTCAEPAAEPPARVEQRQEPLAQELADYIHDVIQKALADDDWQGVIDIRASDLMPIIRKHAHKQASPVEGEPREPFRKMAESLCFDLAHEFLSNVPDVVPLGDPRIQDLADTIFSEHPDNPNRSTAAPSGEPRAKCPRGTAQQWRLSGKYYEADYETRFWTDERVEVFLESFFPLEHVGERVAELPNNEELSKAITSRLMGRFTFFWGAVDSLTKKFGPFSDDVAAEIRAALASLRGVQEKRG